MSDSSNNARRSQSGGGSGNRNRNRNRNRNQNRNRPRGGGSGGNPQSGNRRSGGRRTRKGPKRVPLTWWQKILKALGLHKETVRPPRKRGEASSTGDNRKEPRKAPKSGTRVAKTSSSSSGREAPSPEDVESNRLYLGNLSYDAAEYELEELFKGVGAVRSIEIVYNRNTHRSKGYGFIEMATIDEAKRAVEVLHDQPFMGRKMIVSGAKSKGESDSGHE